MILSLTAVPVPLRLDEGGTYRIGQTRVPLETLVSAYLAGHAIARIIECFPMLQLADVYAVLGYYLGHQEEVHQYLAEREAAVETIRQQIDSRPKQIELRARWLAYKSRQA